MKKLKVASLLLCAGLFLAGCGDGGGSPEGPESEGKSSISWMAMLHTASPPSGDVTQKLEEYTGVEIDFTWVPDASKTERLNAALASNSLADIVSLTEINNTTVRSSLASGMFWDVEPYLEEFPNLAEISEDRLESSRIDGRIYGVPFLKPIARYGVLVRKDWLDNLGLDVPSTLEELAAVAQAFTEDDPDGNGADDTVGFVERDESFNVGFRSLSGYFGADNWFTITDDDEVMPSFMQPEYKEAMEWFRNIYDNGWMNSDFAVMAKNDQKNYIVQGRGGIVLSGLQEVRNYIDDAAGTDEEHMEWVLINDIVHENVERRILSDTNGGMGGWLAIPKNNVETEEDLRVVLKFINDLMDEEPFTLMTQGIEGVHYEIDDEGVYVRLDDTKWQQEVQPFSSSRPSELVTVFPSSNPYVNLANEKIRENEEFAVINPAQSLNSETYDRSWSSLIEGISDAYYQYMTGEIEIDGFDTAIETFLRNGGQQIIDEFTEDYRSQQ
ncbi:extracellular solute-binding protein [Enterococcus casseliflavus]|uniref:extracellular solute-binding protein n=1 Tax=Enterococcus casseliflavus TaxID=37734 RepID=UPI00115C82C3|nr:extracellular solute-binding protein [Enterococcus casseliflavus]MDT2979720.1 extracellular solute-binding protein [Enterococcus casseliflavus]MEB6211845.1 extracellular solute-binding protein [Enterococcus casseliflavus]